MIRPLAAALLIWATRTFEPSTAAAEPSVTVDSVLEKYVQAIGGKAKIEKVKSRVQKGEFIIMGQAAPLEQLHKGPNKFYSFVKIEGVGDFFEGVDGSTAWAKDPNGVREKQGAEAIRAKRDADLQREIKLKTLFPNLTYKATEKLGADEVQVLESKSDAGLDRMTFNAKTGLLVGHYGEFNGADGNQVKVTTRLGEYTEVDGIKYAFEREVKILGGFGEFEMTLKLKEIKHDVEIPDTKFAKPSE